MTTSDRVIFETSLPFPRKQGKVRDVYDLGEHLLIVATDRISAFDCVMPNGIPQKGEILTALSLFWFEQTKSMIENHIVATDVNDFPRAVRSYGDQLINRSILAKKTKVVPIECVVRGYLSGSGWKEYQKTQSVCSVKLPAGLIHCDKLSESIFTPSTKAESGHDENISYEIMVQQIGSPLAEKLRDSTQAIYRWCADYALNRGVIIADTKFEFGLKLDGTVILIDEILTPDSSRFWPADEYEPGHDQPSFDKQFVRNYLETLSWNKTPPAPALPKDVVEGTRLRYMEAYYKLTGQAWQ